MFPSLLLPMELFISFAKIYKIFENSKFFITFFGVFGEFRNLDLWSHNPVLYF